MTIEKKAKKPAEPKVLTVRDLFRLERVYPYVEPAYVGKEDMGLSTRAIGIEVEVENAMVNQSPAGLWQAKEDGSLRNSGTEWVTTPMSAWYAPVALTDLMETCLHKDCCFSPRTSVHVHINCLDMPVEKIANVVMLYAAFEPLLYRFAGRGRNKNIFCVPVQDTSLCDGVSSRSLEQTVGLWSKYTGLNICPLNLFGTIEFRQMHGTRDVKKLVKWIDMLTRLVDFCFEQPTEFVRKMCYHFNDQVEVVNLLGEIFGPNAIEDLQYFGYGDIRESVLRMKRAFLTQNNTVEKVRKEIDRNSPFFTTSIKRGFA